MAAVQLKCEIDGCGMSWNVSSPGKVKASVAEHRKKFHPDWVQPDPQPLTRYQLDYRGRARQSYSVQRVGRQADPARAIDEDPRCAPLGGQPRTMLSALPHPQPLRSEGDDTLPGVSMAQRRVRPAVERSGGLNIRLPDGTTMSTPIRTATGQTSDLCCFCGQGIEHTDPERIRIDAQWEQGGDEREQSWRAHRKCLLERMHEAVIGQGPFFGDD